MIICDLCGEARDCLQKEIEGKEYDICSECWNPLAQRLGGKGRAINREIVLLPPPRAVNEQGDEERPGEAPKIWGAVSLGLLIPEAGHPGTTTPLLPCAIDGG
jgi:hypothetical protein